MDYTLPLVLAVVFLSTFARSAVGFGNALVGMPLLTLVVGIHAATPLMGLLAVAMSALILWDSWQELDLRATGQLVLASFLGMPLGIWSLKHIPVQIVTGGLGLLLAGFGLYSLVRPVLPQLERSGWAYVCGGLAGALGAAYNTNGPPVVVYGALRRWPPARFRATLQGFFLPSSLAISISHGLAGLWNRQIFVMFGFSLLPLLLAVFAGGWVNRRIPVARFTRLLHAILIGLGLLLVTQAL